MLRRGLDRRAGAALGDELVEIDGDHRGLVADERLAPVAVLDLERVRIDHVLPAVVLEALFARYDFVLDADRAF